MGIIPGSMGAHSFIVRGKGAYKPIDAAMAAQTDLVEIVHELRQIVCVKG